MVSGEWFAAFTGTVVDVPGDLDIDHLVPLKNAHNSGGWAWDAEMKSDYANSLSDPDHLIAVTSRANRSKGAKGPDEWKPPDGTYWCRYATDWAEIKAHWNLTMTEAEVEAVRGMLGTCDVPSMVEVRETPTVPTPGQGEATAPVGVVYDSCEDAAFSGETRVEGSSGTGRGFPKSMVPSARDGDGDGVVCET